MPLSLLALAAGAFGIGTTEFIIMGLLTQVSEDLRISIPTAGTLISGYAIGVAIGAPVLTLLTRGWPRKRLLLALMLIFIAGNLAAVVCLAWRDAAAARAGGDLQQRLPLGALVRILPNHACATAAQFSHYEVLMADGTQARWPRFNGW